MRSVRICALYFQMDTLTQEQRSALMSKIRGKNTTPELLVRKYLWSLGFRYRLHRKDLPGSPDLVFSSKRKVVFVHGCFWHGHVCRRDKLPKTRTDFWKEKMDRNAKRDRLNVKKLKKLGWKSFEIWECQVKSGKSFKKLLKFLAD